MSMSADSRGKIALRLTDNHEPVATKETTLEKAERERKLFFFFSFSSFPLVFEADVPTILSKAGRGHQGQEKLRPTSLEISSL